MYGTKWNKKFESNFSVNCYFGKKLQAISETPRFVEIYGSECYALEHKYKQSSQ